MSDKKLIKDVELLLLKGRFDKEVNTTHINYDWDGGHCYSYISHPIMELIEDVPGFEEYTNDWLYSNDDCPPCEIHITKDGEVSSRCGCHDNIDDDTRNGVLYELTSLQRSTKNEYLIKVVKG